MARGTSATVARAQDETALKHEAVATFPGAKPGDLLVVRTGTGRTMTVEANSNGARRGKDVELSRLLRQALKLRVGESITFEPASDVPPRRVVLTPFADLSTASGQELEAHVKTRLMERGVPVSLGLIVHVTYPGSDAGTLYRATQVEGGPGRVTPDTEIKIEQIAESPRQPRAGPHLWDLWVHEQLESCARWWNCRAVPRVRNWASAPKGMRYSVHGTGKTHLRERSRTSPAAYTT